MEIVNPESKEVTQKLLDVFAKKYVINDKMARMNADWIIDGLMESDESENFQPGICDAVAALAYAMASLLRDNDDVYLDKQKIMMMFKSTFESACVYYGSEISVFSFEVGTKYEDGVIFKSLDHSLYFETREEAENAGWAHFNNLTKDMDEDKRKHFQLTIRKHKKTIDNEKS